MLESYALNSYCLISDTIEMRALLMTMKIAPATRLHLH